MTEPKKILFAAVGDASHPVAPAHSCGTCQYARGLPIGRRFEPPKIFIVGIDQVRGQPISMVLYPGVAADDWGCGKWEPMTH